VDKEFFAQIHKVLLHPAQFLTAMGAAMIYFSMDMEGTQFELFFGGGFILGLTGTVLAILLILWPKDPRKERRPPIGVTASLTTKSLAIRCFNSKLDESGDYLDEGWVTFDYASNLITEDHEYTRLQLAAMIGREPSEEEIKVFARKETELRLDLACMLRLIHRKVDESGNVWLRSSEFENMTVMGAPT